MFISSFCSKLLIWVPVYFPALLVPCTFSFISFCLPSLHFFLFWYHTQPFLWAFWLPVFWTLHLIGWLSPPYLVLFLGFCSVLSCGPSFFVLVHRLCCKWWNLRYSPGWSNPLCCIVVLYGGQGQRRNKAACCILFPLSVTSPATHKQIGPFWCWFPNVWVCVCSRILLAPPVDSPERLRVSPATITPTSFYSQIFWGLNCPFFNCWNPWLCSLSHSPVVPPRWFAGKCGTAWPISHHLTTWSASYCLVALAVVFTPPMSLDEHFSFNFLVVRTPYIAIFWWFWWGFLLFLTFLSFWLWGSQAYLPMLTSTLPILILNWYQ